MSAPARLRWREIAQPGGTHPVLPVLVLLGVLGVTALAGMLMPEPSAGPACLAAAVICFAAAYLVWPKPALLAFVLFMLLARTVSNWLQPELAQLDEAVIVTLLALAAARTRPWQHPQWLIPLREGSLLIFLAAGVVGALATGTPIAVWALGFALTAKLFAFFYIVIWHDVSPADVRQAIPVVLGLALVVLAVGALEALAPATVREVLRLGGLGAERESLPSIKSLLWHPGTFAWFTTFVALFLFAGYVVLRRWWLLVGGLLFAGATILSARRRALIALVISLASGFLATIRLRTEATPVGFGGWLRIVIGGGVLALVFLPSLLGLARLTVDEVGDSNTARVALYDASVRIAADHFPLGVGFGRFGSAPSKNPYSPVYTEYGLDRIEGLGPDRPRFVGDAYWAGVLGETGVVGSLGLAVFVAALALGTYRAARSQFTDPLMTAFTLGAWMVLVHSLVETLASAMLDTPSRTYLLFGTVAAALALQRGLKSLAEDADPRLAGGEAP